MKTVIAVTIHQWPPPPEYFDGRRILVHSPNSWNDPQNGWLTAWYDNTVEGWYTGMKDYTDEVGSLAEDFITHYADLPPRPENVT